MAPHLKSLAVGIIILNITCTIFGAIYIASPSYTPAWDVFGIILLVTFFGNLFLSYALDRIIDKTSAIGKKINYWLYIVLILIFSFLVGMLAGNALLSVSYSKQFVDLWAFYLLLYGSYFGLLACGIRTGTLTIMYLRAGNGKRAEASRERSWPERHPRLHKFVRFIFKWYSIFYLMAGVFFCLIILIGPDGGFQLNDELLLRPGTPFLEYLGLVLRTLPGVYGIFVMQFAGFLPLLMLCVCLLLQKLTRQRGSVRLSRFIGVLGLVVSSILIVPMIAAPLGVTDAEKNFAGAFGTDWHSRIDPSMEIYFSPTPFVLPGYYLGVPAKNCRVIPNILFYNDTTGIDDNITLYFDAYLPPNNGVGLPGANSTLIRIHGGGWALGDKGFLNVMQVNKYFAAQGYCVFDIQYGLNDFFSHVPISIFPGLTYYFSIPFPDFICPAHRLGNFTIADMLRHIGLFCQYITLHQPEFGANLSSVFISGGSSGGHLTCATALAIASGNYSTWFGSAITIKGFIPLYPGNDIADFFDTTSDIALINPALMVNSSSPPCLIYQGTDDGLILPKRTQAFQDAYIDAGNNACAIIWLPLSGHAGDYYFSGYYSEIFLYYMERFMYLMR